MFSRSRRRAASRNRSDLEILHAEGFHHAVAADRFLQNLAQFAEARLAGLDRAADAPAEFAHRQEHQGEKIAEASVIFQLVSQQNQRPEKRR